MSAALREAAGCRDLELTAQGLLVEEPVQADIFVAEQARRALTERRIQDMVFWQRVTFRLRMLRAADRGRDGHALV